MQCSGPRGKLHCFSKLCSPFTLDRPVCNVGESAEGGRLHCFFKLCSPFTLHRPVWLHYNRHCLSEFVRCCACGGGRVVYGSPAPSRLLPVEGALHARIRCRSFALQFLYTVLATCPSTALNLQPKTCRSPAPSRLLPVESALYARMPLLKPRELAATIWAFSAMSNNGGGYTLNVEWLEAFANQCMLMAAQFSQQVQCRSDS